MQYLFKNIFNFSILSKQYNYFRALFPTNVGDNATTVAVGIIVFFGAEGANTNYGEGGVMRIQRNIKFWGLVVGLAGHVVVVLDVNINSGRPLDPESTPSWRSQNSKSIDRAIF